MWILFENARQDAFEYVLLFGKKQKNEYTQRQNFVKSRISP